MATARRRDKFPLWLHPSGQWCKKIKGRFYYFGIDRDEALKRYVAEREDIQAGRPPRRRHGDTTVAELVDTFLTEKRNRLDAGELSARTWADYYATCKAVTAEFGKARPVADLRPADFAKLRAGVACRLGPVSVLNFVTRVRVLFKFAYDFDLIPHPVKYGSGFDRPAKKTLRLERRLRAPRLIPAADVWKLIRAADPQLRAMILLALNGGLGSSDCARLTRASLAQRAGWLNYPRPKTEAAREFPLWPETIEALAAVSAIRPAAKDPADDGLVFLTRLGKPWVRFNSDDKGKRSVIDSVAQMFAKLAARKGVQAAGGFYTLRHVHRTISDEAGDRPAADRIMGHTDQSVTDYYREIISDDRLRAVTDHVRAWLLAGRPRRCPPLQRRTLADTIRAYLADQ